MSKSALQNPEGQNVEGPRKKQALDTPNGISATPTTGSAIVNPSTTNGHQTNGASQQHLTGLVSEQQVPAQPETSLRAPQISMHQALEGLGEAPKLQVVQIGYQDFKDLVSRVARETWAGMVDTIELLSSGHPIEPNEARHETAKTSQDFLRRRRIWDYVHDKRVKLIKLLVLSQWCRNMDDVKQLIEINAYMCESRQAYNDSAYWIGVLKRDMRPLMENPADLELSMQLLSTTKADGISDLGYLPQKPMTIREMLNAMREINSILAFRLSSHEAIPEAFSDYIIRDGRVTFKVEDEFELSLSIGNEKLDEQFYFVNFRFCFSPGGETIRDHSAQRQLEFHVNHILGKEGLGACYDFLHDFTLTHKLSVLRMQAVKLARTRWGDNIKYEQVHRALVLQYWTNRPGAKSWIEIGIRKKRPQSELRDGETLDTSQLSIRWHRQGKEVRDHGLEIDGADLSLETILKDTVAAHINSTLAQTKLDLQDTDKAQSNMPCLATHHESPIEPAECALDITFPDGKQIMLNQEPVSGWFSILPPSKLHNSVEHDLNRMPDPAKDMVHRLRQLRATSSWERHRTLIAIEGWPPMELPRMSRDLIDRNLGKDAYMYQFYRLQSAWGENMCLCLSHHTSGMDVWRLVETLPKEQWAEEKKTANVLLPVEINPVRRQLRICTVPIGTRDDLSGLHPSPHYFLRWVTSQAAAIVSRTADLSWLAKGLAHPVKHIQIHLSEKTAHETRQRLQAGILTPFDPVETSRILVDLNSVGNESLADCYGDRVLTIVDGVDHVSGKVITNTIARLAKALPITGTTLFFDQGSIHVAKNDSRVLCIRLETPIASSSIAVLVDRMSGFARIASCVADLRKMGLTVETFDLKQITASLGPLIQNRVKTRKMQWTDEQLRVFFSCDEKGPTGVKFAEKGPYHALTPHFNDYLRHANGKFELLAQELCAIAPALCTLAEQRRDATTAPLVTLRSPREYHVSWGIRNGCKFGYTMKHANVDGESCWVVKFASSQGDLPEQVQKVVEAWNALCRTSGTGFVGLTSFLSVSFKDASSALWTIMDAFAPHITAWHAELKKAQSSSEGGDTGSIGAAKATGAGTGAGSAVSKQPAKKANKQSVVVLD